MNQHETQAEIGRIRENGVLGRAGVLSRLFDFLAERAFDERPPKEAEIALKVFGRATDAEGSQDAAVRVYVHRLRRKLEEHYLRNPSGVRIVLPKGEYRLVGETLDAPPALPPPAPLRIRREWLLPGLAVLLVALNLAAWAFVAGGSIDRQTAEVRRTALWSPLAKSRFPALIVVGDYYLVGERGENLEVERLVREFSVNSRDDLYEFLMVHPEMTDQYIDVGLSYLPVSTGAAVQRISRVVPAGRSVRVIPASEFTPEMLKTNDVIYVGHLSALGRPLRDAVFSASRLTFGDTYDEIVDTVGGRTYESQAGAGAVLGGVYSDYGYLASLEGPNGNRIIVVAGTRDTSALGLSEIATQASALRTLGARTGKAASFEALYRVRGSGHVNFETDLVLASPVDAKKIWQGGALTQRRFPTG